MRLLTSEDLLVGDTGIEPVTPTVSKKKLPKRPFELRTSLFMQVGVPCCHLLCLDRTRSDGLSCPRNLRMIMDSGRRQA
jgi:hypothetical protein